MTAVCLRAATRDASFTNRPRTSGPVKYHVVADTKAEVAACGEWLFCDHAGHDETVAAAGVPARMRCMKPGCRRRWPGARELSSDRAPLVQELVDLDLHYPWRVLVCCALLNQTQGAQARPAIDGVFARCPAPTAMLEQDLADLLQPLGLQLRRAVLLRRMSWDYLAGAMPGECHGAGGYARDALLLLVHGVRHLSPVRDAWLRSYASWRSNELQRAPPVDWDRRGHDAWRKASGFEPLRPVWGGKPGAKP